MAMTGILRVPSGAQIRGLSGGMRARQGLRGLGECQWFNGSWVDVLANGSIMGCGVPPAAPQIPGTSTGAAIINRELDWANDPFLNSPAYLAAEAKDGATVASNAADAVTSLNEWCNQSKFNHDVWGTPIDTASCTPTGAPLPTLIGQAQAIVTPNFFSTTPTSPVTPPATVIASGGGSGTQGGGQNVVTTTANKPAPPPPDKTTPQNSTTNAGNNASTSLLPPGFLAWFNDSSKDLIPGVPNWILVAAGVGALVFIPMLTKGGHRG